MDLTLSRSNFIPLTKVKGDSYYSDFYLVEKDLLYFDRTHNWSEAAVEIDVFGRFWSLAFGTTTPGQLAVGRMGEKIPIVGDWYFFIPPFSLVEWRPQAGVLEWHAFISQVPVPRGLPNQPVAFRPNRPIPRTANEIFDLVRAAPEFLLVGKVEMVSAVAERAKALIDQTYSGPLKVADLARQLGFSHAAMTRAFHRTYGLSPVAYRNKLRVFDSLRLLMMNGVDVAVAGHDVGFVDISRYQKQFRREMNTVASHYRFRKK